MLFTDTVVIKVAVFVLAVLGGITTIYTLAIMGVQLREWISKRGRGGEGERTNGDTELPTLGAYKPFEASLAMMLGSFYYGDLRTKFSVDRGWRTR